MLAILLSFLMTPANATKCFKGDTEKEFVEIFPAVIQGKIIERKQSGDSPLSFRLRISKTKTIKGTNLGDEFTSEEVHYGDGSFGHFYSVGDEFIFPLSDFRSKDGLKILLPADGCPSLPKPKEK